VVTGTVVKAGTDEMVTVLDQLFVTVCRTVEVVGLEAPGVAELGTRDEPGTVDVPMEVNVSGQIVVDTATTEVTSEGAADLRGQLVTLSGQRKTV
jgi:hypothetical protein